MSKNLNNHGFTIIELLISTAIFSTILLLCATAIIQVGRIFYKGVTINRTQETARRVLDDISQSIQFGANTGDSSFMRIGGRQYNSPDLYVRSICLGEIRYSWSETTSLGTGTGQSSHVLWKDRIGSNDACSAVDLRSSQPSLQGIELLGGNMRVSYMDIRLPANTTLWNINVNISYGTDNDLFEKFANGSTNYNKCISTATGGQFCAVSIMSTNVAKRL